MASPTLACQKGSDTAEVDFTPDTPSTGSESHNETNERQLMLEKMSGAPLRTLNGPHALLSGDESPLATLRMSASAPSFEPPVTDTIPSPYRVSRASSSRSMRGTSSPLNPNNNVEKAPTPTGSPFNSLTRPGSRDSSFLNRIPSEEIRALAGLSPGNRGSFMILYKKAELDDSLPPPSFPSYTKRPSSFSSDMQMSLSSDSKYPSGMFLDHGLVAYAYDPSMDEREPMDDEDLLHNPDEKTAKIDGPMSWRGLKNIGMLAALIAALMCLFVVYPVYSFYSDNGRNARIVGNTKINATGQAEFTKREPNNQLPILSTVRMIDPSTPEDVRTRLTPNGDLFTLVFSDEFESAGRVFTELDDVWFPVENWNHDSQPVTTQAGSLVINFDEKGDGAVLRSRSPFCFTEGAYVEINATLPDTVTSSRFFWSGRWSESVEADIIPEGEGFHCAMAVTMALGNLYSATSESGVLLIDYIRVYQRAPLVNSLCDDILSPITSITFPW